MKTTLIFDGNNALWRLAKKMPQLTGPDGKPIQVVYGFLRLIRAGIEDFEPNAALVVWDSGKPRLRIEMDPQYKAQRRKERDPEKEREFQMVMSQFRIVQKTLSHLGVRQISIPDIEADDLISVSCKTLQGKKIIVSSDQDMLQLVSESVSVFSPVKKVLYSVENFQKEIGLSPRQFLEMRALAGDRSDEIPGVAKGFGEVTAKELISKYGSIETLYLPSVEKEVSSKGKRYALLYSKGAKERAELNLRLMDLSRIESGTAAALIRGAAAGVQDGKLDKLAVLKYFREQQFNSLLSGFITWLKPFEMLSTEK